MTGGVGGVNQDRWRELNSLDRSPHMGVGRGPADDHINGLAS
jgi:hypothetical protein